MQYCFGWVRLEVHVSDNPATWRTLDHRGLDHSWVGVGRLRQLRFKSQLWFNSKLRFQRQAAARLNFSDGSKSKRLFSPHKFHGTSIKSKARMICRERTWHLREVVSLSVQGTWHYDETSSFLTLRCLINKRGRALTLSFPDRTLPKSQGIRLDRGRVYSVVVAPDSVTLRNSRNTRVISHQQATRTCCEIYKAWSWQQKLARDIRYTEVDFGLP